LVKATTVYIDSKILHAAKIKAVEMHKSVSKLVNEALRLVLQEDAADIQATRSRRKEATRSFGDVLKDLKSDGLI